MTENDDTPNETTRLDNEPNDRTVTRRDALKASGAALGTSALNVAASSPIAASSREVEPPATESDIPADEPVDRSAMTERRLNISNGEELSDYVANSNAGELLVVPEGTYTWSSGVQQSKDNWGIRGEWGGRVTIEVPDRWGIDNDDRLLNAHDCDNVLVENLYFDTDVDGGRACPGFRTIVDTAALLHHLVWLCGGVKTNSNSGLTRSTCGAADPAGHVMNDGLVCHSRGSIDYNTSDNLVWCSRDGKLTVRNCKWSGSAGNVIYTRMSGEMIVENCVFANTTPSCIRVGGDNETIRNCTFYMDVANGELYETDGNSVNTSFLMADNKQSASNGGHAENCSFVVENTPNATGSVRMFENRWFDVQDCQFLLNQGDIPGVGVQDEVDDFWIERTSFATENSSGATAAEPISGSYHTTNVCVDDGLDPGAISPDSANCEFDWSKAHPFPRDDHFTIPDGSGDGTTQVDEDFSHDDVPSTYSFDTGAFTTSSTRSTSESYSLLADDGSDGSSVILRDDMVTTAGDTYTLDVYHQSSSDADMGFLFAAQDSTTGWSDYTGYLGFFDSNGDEIRLDYWENGSLVSSQTSAVIWPLDEWLTVELDYRANDSSTITTTVFDASDGQLASVSLGDTSYDSGTVGWYNYHATSDWYADSWFQGEHTSAAQVAEDFSHGDVSGIYGLDTGAFTTSSSRLTTDGYSLRADDGTDNSSIVLREDMVTTAGDTYTLDVFHKSGSDADMGFLFGAQDGATGWGDYTGYLGFFDSNSDEIRIDRWSSGTRSAVASTAVTWPLDEWLTVELDYRETDASTITVTVSDAAGTELVSVSLGDTTHDNGAVGWYTYHAAADWHADSWFNAQNTPVKVLDNFSHDNIAGTYSLDTGAFTTSSTRSTSDSYSLLADDGSDGSQIVLRDDKQTIAGDIYELDVYHQSSSDADMGFLFAAQDSTTGWSDYTGYLGFFDSNGDEIRLDYWENGSPVSSGATATTWPLDEWLTVELDYRGTDSSTQTMTVFDASGNEVASVSLGDTTLNSGGFGWYTYHAAADWHADSWFDL